MTTVQVKGMTCEGCEEVVETAVELLDGVDEADADRYDELVHASGDATIDEVADKVELAGYRALGSAEADIDMSPDSSTEEPETTAKEAAEAAVEDDIEGAADESVELDEELEE